MGVVAVVIGIFFVAGLFVGGIAVIALPALRPKGFGRPRRRDRADWADRPGGPDDRPRWPGEADGEDPGR